MSQISYGFILTCVECSANVSWSMFHTKGGEEGGGGRTGRTAKLDARFGGSERKEGSTMKLTMMRSWMEPRAISRREVRIGEGGWGSRSSTTGCQKKGS